MKIIGITGGTGTGKTTLLKAFEKFWGIGIDADAVYHMLLKSSSEMKNEIGRVFPETVENGGVNRKKLGEIVFNDSAMLKKLNETTHKYVRCEIEDIISKAQKEGARFAAIDAVELIESGLGDICSIKFAVTAPTKMRIERIMRREGISLSYAAMRVTAQKPDSYYEKNCDVVVLNDFDSAEMFEKHCIGILNKYLGE